MSQEIKLGKLINVLLNQFLTHGFPPEKMVNTLTFLYDLGWSVGFDEGFEQNLKSESNREKSRVEPVDAERNR